MADTPGPGEPAGFEELSEPQLRQEFHAQTAKIAWHELQPHYARGAVVFVATGLDLVDVAVQLRLDNKTQFEQWLARGEVSRVSDRQAAEMFEENPQLWAVVVAPWVLVQRQAPD